MHFALSMLSSMKIDPNVSTFFLRVQASLGKLAIVFEAFLVK